jgi:hypothetical protein
LDRDGQLQQQFPQHGTPLGQAQVQQGQSQQHASVKHSVVVCMVALQ